MLRQRIAHDEAIWLLAEADGEAVGFCAVLCGRADAELATMYVLPEVQWHGV